MKAFGEMRLALFAAVLRAEGACFTDDTLGADHLVNLQVLLRELDGGYRHRVSKFADLLS